MNTEVTRSNLNNMNANTDTNMHLTTMMTMMPPSPLVQQSSKEQQQQQQQPPPVKSQPPERRKFYMEKLFSVSRMHVSEAGITSLSHQTIDNDKNVLGVRRGFRINSKEPLRKSRITYSVDGDTTTTNSSVGVDEDINDLSSKEGSTTPTSNDDPQQQQQLSTPTAVTTTTIIGTEHLPVATTILLELPNENQEIMEIQTDRCVDATEPKNVETAPPLLTTTTTTTSLATPTSAAMRITKVVIPSTTKQYHSNDIQNCNENLLWNTPSPSTVTTPIFALPIEDEMPPPSPPVSTVVPTSMQKVPKHKHVLKSESGTSPRSYSNFWGFTTALQPAIVEKRQQQARQSRSAEWPPKYFGTILDKVTKIQCITNCSDIDLTRCDDTVEDYIASPLHTAAKQCSGNDNQNCGDMKHRSSANSMLRRDDPSSASNSMYTDDDYEEDDLGTHDDSMISASLFDNDTFEDEYTYTTYENDDENDEYQHPNGTNTHVVRKTIDNLPLHLQKSLLSDPSCNTSKYMGDDDGTSFSSQNSAWL
jgi:hypothetical protein